MKDLRVFGFEDERRWLDRIVAALGREISPEDQKRYGIGSIELELASSKREALRLLQDAVAKGKPPDIILLDLRIPLEEGGEPENEIGIELLKEAQEMNAVREVLVYSFL